MDAAYWNRQLSQPPANVPKRQRTENDITVGSFPGQEAQIFSPQIVHGSIQATKDSRVLGASYDRYLQNKQQVPSYGSTQAGLVGMSRSTGGGMPGNFGGKTSITYQDPVMLDGPGFRSLGPPDIAENSSAAVSFHNQASMDPTVIPMIPEREISLPPDASSTLFVEGLPRDASEREVAHIFRPFLGYKDIRLVKKEPRYGGGPIILCFVDFKSPSYAMTAMGAVEGYILDLHDPDSSPLHLQFAKFTSRRQNQSFHGRGDR